ncbi:LLM class flavin-dependent oxidoreductase [Ktedonobacter racemifer]|uniref:Luciferase-like, subgroup n=1 Tax=Ktedonobacter racemifer DSM 44963 TaxID=485913 RepID=D6TPE5_KTERA|nr:TIGR03619 family F420-dependent LLM class oxidoreductase [Ktedonobacter racemifer]EFH85559.1 Luciferase-like, subgroup [Ktedonobacter racemifer DSM 44963]
MHFAISIPQRVPDGTFDPAKLRDYLTRAESLGFHSAWTQEVVLGSAPALAPLELRSGTQKIEFGSVPTLAPLELMTFAAACTTRLRLGCAVFVSPLHNPIHLAKSISTLDQLSRGRIEVGVGSGGGGRMFSAFEVDPASLIARFTEGLRLMKACWTEPRINFSGRFWQLDGASMEPKPFQKPYPPLWIGANHPAAVRRALRYGNGFFGAGSSTTAQFAQQIHVLREALAESKQDPSFQIAKRVYIAVDDNVTRAHERVDAGLKQIYGSSGMTAVAVYGPPSACIKGLREVADAGAELIQLHPLFDEAEQMERLAAEVISEVQNN